MNIRYMQLLYFPLYYIIYIPKVCLHKRLYLYPNLTNTQQYVAVLFFTLNNYSNIDKLPSILIIMMMIIITR